MCECKPGKVSDKCSCYNENFYTMVQWQLLMLHFTVYSFFLSWGRYGLYKLSCESGNFKSAHETLW